MLAGYSRFRNRLWAVISADSGELLADLDLQNSRPCELLRGWTITAMS